MLEEKGNGGRKTGLVRICKLYERHTQKANEKMYRGVGGDGVVYQVMVNSHRVDSDDAEFILLRGQLIRKKGDRNG